MADGEMNKPRTWSIGWDEALWIGLLAVALGLILSMVVWPH